MRCSIVVLLLALLAAPVVADEPPFLIVKLTSVRDVLTDLEALGMFEDPQAEADVFLHEMVEPLNLPLGPWLDRERPAFMTAALAGLMGGGKQPVTAMLPALDVGDALRALGGDPEAEPDDGIHEIDRGDDPAWFVLADDDYLTIGMARDDVAGFDRAAVESLEFPPGSMGVDVNVAVVAPLVRGQLATQRQMMQQLAQQQREQQLRDPQHAGQEAPGSEATPGMMDFSFDMVLTVLQNASRLQLSLDRAGEMALLRTHVVPVEESELQALLAAQPVGFSKLGRAVPAGPALVSYAGNFHLTDGLREGLSQLMNRSIGMMEQMADAAPEMAIATRFAGGQQEVMMERLACTSGEMAGVWDMSPDQTRTIQLSAVLPLDECEGLADRELESMKQLVGPDGESLITVTEPNVAPDEVRAMRVEIDVEHLVQDDVATAGMVESMLGDHGGVTFYGQRDDVTIRVSGADAEATFTEVVDRLQSRRRRGGLTAETFAPLEADAGFFAVVDLSRFDSAALFGMPLPDEATAGDGEGDGEGDAAKERSDGRMVLGVRARHGKLAVELALPAEMLATWFAQDEDDGRPPGLWPPPPAPVEVAPENKVAQSAPGIPRAGEGDVTSPVIAHKIPPDYPEVLRLARLEGVVLLQAVVTREGRVADLEVLQCDGNSPDEAQPRKNLLHESAFCTAMIDAAMAAVERWRYEPARRNDEPVDVYFTVRVAFELE